MEVANIQNTANLLECILWQYDNATKLKALVQSCQDEFEGNTKDFWDNFYTNVFNLDTANSFGLAVWGLCLGIERPRYTYGGQEYVYSDDMYRLFLKSRSNFFSMDGSIYQFNRYMEFLFPNKPILVIDNLDMTFRVVFYYTPTAEEWLVLNNPDFLPRPSGVELELVIIAPEKIFGFEGSLLAGFDQGTFFS